MSQLVINCSSDRLQIRIGNVYHELSNKGLEISFGPQIIEWIKQYDIKEVLVINGPGSFTTLRVVCLVINLYLSMNPDSIAIYECNKIELYHHLDVSQMYLFIGQRNNVWSYDYTSQTSVIIPKSDLSPDILLDDVSDAYSDHPKATLQVRDHRLSITYQGIIRAINLKDMMTKVTEIQPHYLMQPNTGK